MHEIRLNTPPVWPEGMNAIQAQLAVPEWGILEFIGEFMSNEDDGARRPLATILRTTAILATAGQSWISAPGGNFLMYSLPVAVSKILASRKAMNHG